MSGATDAAIGKYLQVEIILAHQAHNRGLLRGIVPVGRSVAGRCGDGGGQVRFDAHGGPQWQRQR